MKTALKSPGFTQTLSFKLILIGFLCLILLIRISWIQQIISERETRNREVSKEISSVWGGEQIIAGPLLSIPYKKSVTQGDKTFLGKTGMAHFLPEQLSEQVCDVNHFLDFIFSLYLPFCYSAIAKLFIACWEHWIIYCTGCLYVFYPQHKLV